MVFDSDMADEHTPAITIGLRGMVQAAITVRTAERDLHSGMYGGSVLNALHVLHAMLAQVMPGPDGRLRPELRAGIEEPAAAERESWARLRPGDEVLAEVGGRPVHPGAGAEYYERNGADASLDVNFVEGGEPRTVVPSLARAQLSMRLAPRQRSADLQPVMEELLRSAVPEGAEVEIDWHLAEPSLFDVDEPAIQLAAQAIERACGTAPVMQRSGGSIPIVAELAAAGIPTIVGGFALADDAIHAPNESYRLESLRPGRRRRARAVHGAGGAAGAGHAAAVVSGTVYLVGAGPGDPGLMTRRSLELIAAADAILYDRLIPPGALDGARPDADLRYVGKQPGGHSMEQERHQRAARRARPRARRGGAAEGRRPVRVRPRRRGGAGAGRRGHRVRGRARGDRRRGRARVRRHPGHASRRRLRGRLRHRPRGPDEARAPSTGRRSRRSPARSCSTWACATCPGSPSSSWPAAGPRPSPSRWSSAARCRASAP